MDVADALHGSGSDAEATDESVMNTAKPSSIDESDEQNAIHNRGIVEQKDFHGSRTHHQPMESVASLSEAQPDMAPSEIIQNAMETESVGKSSGSLSEEADTISSSVGPAQAEAARSPDVITEIPDSSQVSLLSSPYEECNLTSNAGYTSTSHAANLPAGTEDAQEDQIEGQSKDDQLTQEVPESDSKIDLDSSSQHDIAQQPSGPTPNLTEPPKDKRIVSPMHSFVTTGPS